jgi:hypothetical protein
LFCHVIFILIMADCFVVLRTPRNDGL